MDKNERNLFVIPTHREQLREREDSQQPVRSHRDTGLVVLRVEAR
jgi:hypothetical protein